MDREQLANGLGWFSIALGFFEVASPRSLTECLGMEGREGLVQAYGVREIVKGIGILTQPTPAPWVWGRVAGDILDLATLGSALTPDNPKRRNVELAIANVVTVTMLDILCAKQLSEKRGFEQAREGSQTESPGEVRAGDHTLALGQPAEFAATP